MVSAGAGEDPERREAVYAGELLRRKGAYNPLLEIQAGWIRGPDYETFARVSARTCDMIFTQPVLYEFPDLQMPTLLIIGERDRTAIGTGRVPDSVAVTMGLYDQLGDEAAQAIPNSRLVELPGIWHVPQYEAFDQFRKALLGFLQNVDE